LIAPWYVHQSIAIAQGKELSNIAYLASMANKGVVAAFAAKPLCWFLAVAILLSLRDATARKILLWVLAPLLILWALFFSYEVRTASVAFPFAAFCAAAGLFRGQATQPRNPRAVSININWYYPVAAAICALAILSLR